MSFFLLLEHKERLEPNSCLAPLTCCRKKKTIVPKFQSFFKISSFINIPIIFILGWSIPLSLEKRMLKGRVHPQMKRFVEEKF